MSTATLLIVTTRLRSLSERDRNRPSGRPTCADARYPLSRVRVFLAACLFILLAPALPPQLVRAQDAATHAPARIGEEASRTIGGKASQVPCVIVEIAGERSGHLDCATRRLQEAARIAQGEARAGIDAPIPQTGSPDVQLGIANQTATRLRMGSALGRSVHPERPASRPRAVRP